MADLLEEYLGDLRSELVALGADPAVIQDAEFDAGEHLALAGDNGGFESAVAAYGSPSEVAAAYLSTETTVQQALQPPVGRRAQQAQGRITSTVRDPGAWSALAYLVLSAATGIAYFTVVAVGLGITAGLAIFVVGVPFFLLFVGVIRALSLVEGRVVETLLGERMPRRPLLGPRNTAWLARIKHWLTDRRTWTTIVYLAVQLPLGVIYFAGTMASLAFGLWMIVGPVVQVVTGIPFLRDVDGAEYSLEAWAVLPVMALGALLLLALVYVAPRIGRLHGRYAKWMLVGSAGRLRDEAAR